MIYRARHGQSSYGQAIGVIVLEDHIPYPPGCPGNATTFSYPVRYEVARGASIESLKVSGTAESAAPFLEAGRALVKAGVRAITGNCGLMISHQQYLAAELPVPVLMSSLLQIPFVARALGPSDKIGILASSKNNLKPHHLEIVTGGVPVSTVVSDMSGCEGFQSAIMREEGELDFFKVQSGVMSTVKNLLDEDISIRALVFECTDLSPYARAVQQEFEIPVFDIITLIDFFHSASFRKDFKGHM